MSSRRKKATSQPQTNATPPSTPSHNVAVAPGSPSVGSTPGGSPEHQHQQQQQQQQHQNQNTNQTHMQQQQQPNSTANTSNTLLGSNNNSNQSPNLMSQPSPQMQLLQGPALQQQNAPPLSQAIVASTSIPMQSIPTMSFGLSSTPTEGSDLWSQYIGYLDHEISSAVLDPSSRLCDSIDWETGKKRSNCRHKVCYFAHSWDMLQPPRASVDVHAREYGSIPISFYLKLQNREPKIRTTLAYCYPTKYTAHLIEAAKKGVAPTYPHSSVCKIWATHRGKCHKWSNCVWVHLPFELIDQFRHSANCLFGRNCVLLPNCKYVHPPNSPSAPPDVQCFGGSELVTVVETDSNNNQTRREVPMNTIMKTLHTEQAVVRKQELYLCPNMSFCDDWHNCLYVHIHPDRRREIFGLPIPQPLSSPNVWNVQTKTQSKHNAPPLQSQPQSQVQLQSQTQPQVQSQTQMQLQTSPQLQPQSQSIQQYQQIPLLNKGPSQPTQPQPQTQPQSPVQPPQTPPQNPIQTPSQVPPQISNQNQAQSQLPHMVMFMQTQPHLIPPLSPQHVNNLHIDSQMHNHQHVSPTLRMQLTPPLSSLLLAPQLHMLQQSATSSSQQTAVPLTNQPSNHLPLSQAQAPILMMSNQLQMQGRVTNQARPLAPPSQLQQATQQVQSQSQAGSQSQSRSPQLQAQQSPRSQPQQPHIQLQHYQHPQQTQSSSSPPQPSPQLPQPHSPSPPTLFHPIAQYPTSHLGKLESPPNTPTSPKRTDLRSMLSLPDWEGEYKDNFETKTELLESKLLVPFVPSSNRYRRQLQEMVKRGIYSSLGAENQRILWHPSFEIERDENFKVYLGIREEDSTEVALKYFPPQPVDYPASEQMFTAEVKEFLLRHSLSGVRHHYSFIQNTTVLDAPGFRVKVAQRALVLELMEGSLIDVVDMWKQDKLFGTPLHLQSVRYIIGSVLTTLRELWQELFSTPNYHLCSNNYCIHRDIKPANIFVDVNRKIKLIDFRSSRVSMSDLNVGRTSSVSPTLTKIYASPESIDASSASSDLFSVGLILYYLLTGEEDWGSSGDAATKEDSSVQKFSKLPGCCISKWPQKAYAAHHLICNLVQKIPDERANYASLKNQAFGHILSHPFFWSDERSLAFLVLLGNCKTDFFDTAVAVVLIKDANSENWLDAIKNKEIHAYAHKWATQSTTKAKARLSHSSSLLVVIRKLYQNSALLEQPLVHVLTSNYNYFLMQFPSLVVTLWEHCHKNSFGPHCDNVVSPLLNMPYAPSLDIGAEHEWF
ncbi:Protein kinase domain [Pelomyxa schiedti]|nr:Protein kinase domain [Pelomyxa schiedti]